MEGLEKEEQEIKEEITEGMHNGAPAKEVEAEEGRRRKSKRRSKRKRKKQR